MIAITDADKFSRSGPVIGFYFYSHEPKRTSLNIHGLTGDHSLHAKVWLTPVGNFPQAPWLLRAKELREIDGWSA